MLQRTSLIFVLVVTSLLLGLTREASAYSNEWRWTILGHSGSWPTKTQAIQYLHSLASSDPRYGLLTIETTQLINDTNERVLLTGEPVEPVTGEWSYWNGEVAGPAEMFPSDTALADVWISIAPGSPQCGGTTITGLGDWTPILTWVQYGNTVGRESREYKRIIPSYSNGVCNTYEDQLTFIRSRSVTCPEYYSSGGPEKPGCKLGFSRNLLGARNTCEDKCSRDGKRGNPVQAMTGDKTETAIDYSGPDGLHLTRSYHTKSLDRRARMGAGWTTNWHRSIAGENFGGFTRADGYNENLDKITSSHYISNAHDRVQIKKISSSIWHMYYPNGAIDVYNSKGQLLEAHSPGGAVITIAYDEKWTRFFRQFSRPG